MKNVNLRLLLAAMLFVSSLFFSQVAWADDCKPKCDLRSDGCIWCCEVTRESSFHPKCDWCKTTACCKKQATTCPTNDEDGSGPGGFLP